MKPNCGNKGSGRQIRILGLPVILGLAWSVPGASGFRWGISAADSGSVSDVTIPYPNLDRDGRRLVIQAKPRYNTDFEKLAIQRPILRAIHDTPQTDRSAEDARVSFSFPFSEDVLRAGDLLQIRGTAKDVDGFLGYVLDYGEGAHPKTWSAAGMVLAGGGVQSVQDGILGSWDTSLLPRPRGRYTLRLIATYQSGRSQTFARNIHFDPSLKKGWPVRIPITIKPGTDSAYDSIPAPVVADLEQDGIKEIIALRGGGSPPLWPQLMVFNSDGSTRWTRELKGGALYWFWSAPPLVCDLDKNKKPEIVVASLNNGWVYCFEPDGSMRPGWPVRHSRVTYSLSDVRLLAGDVDGDGRIELVIVSSDWDPNLIEPMTTITVQMFSPNGRLKRRWTLKTPGQLVHSFRYQVALGNFDPAPGMEIVIGVPLAYLSRDESYGVAWICKGSGSVLPGWPIRFSNPFGGNVVIGDLDKDGWDEVVFSLYKENPDRTGGIWALDTKGRTLPGWPARTQRSVLSSPAVGDVDDDGYPEVVTLDYLYPFSDPQLCVLEPDGTTSIGWPRPAPDASNFGCMLADIDGDNSTDILVDYGGFGPAAGRVVAYHLNGSMVKGFPKDMNTGQSWLEIADLDADGTLELVAASYLEYSPWKESYPRRAGSIYVWELNGPCDADLMPWPRFQRDAGHTGRYRTTPPDGVCTQNSATGAEVHGRHPDR